MSKRTRYFMFAAIATLVFGLSIGLVAFYNGGLPNLGSAAAGPEQLRYVPGNAVVVAYADVHHIMSSQFRQRLKQLEAGKGEKGQQEFRDETGIDLENDVDNVVAFMTAAEGEGRHGGGAVIVTGRFDQTRIETLITGKGGQVEEYNGGKRLFRFKGKGDESGALTFLAGNQVAVGSFLAVRGAMDVAEGRGEAIKSNAKMEKLIGEVAPKGNAWVVGRFDALTNQARLPDEVTSRIPPISWFAASGEINGGVAAEMTVETANEDAAKNLAMVIEGLKGLAGLQAGNHAAQMQQALQSFGISQDKNQLTVRFRVPSELLDALTPPVRRGGELK